MVQDHSSLSNINEIITTNVHYDLIIDFANKVISGSAKVTILPIKEGVKKLFLDTRELRILGVRSSGQALKYSLASPHQVLGSCLEVALQEPCAIHQKREVEVEFQTSPKSTALQWLEPAQTAGKKLPYLFSQCQAIHARSFVPCQDSPSVKSTYTATVTVPEGLTALMSANLESETGRKAPDRAGHRVYSFRQDVPIPSYLLAIAVGNLEARSLGARSKVWSEPEVVEAAAFEFQETSKFLEAGESIAGPYVWGNYDILLLPPSFPYGGMENPCLTFATPTLLAGDRSLANVIAHEIAHSWTGNLVSNETWQDFWLNEGWTVFMERRIMGRVKGDATEQFLASQGLLALQLVPDLSGGVDPDDSFSKVPYERGFYFLTYLQKAFEAFMKAYLGAFAFKTVNSQHFRVFFLDYFKDTPEVQGIDWQQWYYGRGMPPEVLDFDTSLAEAASELAEAWHSADIMGIGGAEPRDASSTPLVNWSSEQVVAFLTTLGQLRSLQPLHATTTRKMNRLYDFDTSRNAEIRCAWYQLCINAGDDAVVPLAVEFLKEQGRMKYLRPLYRAVVKKDRDTALRTFAEAQSGYHPIAAKMVASDLGLGSQLQ